MLYTLPDGRIVDLTCVSDVSPIRDFGVDSKSIVKSRLGFTIFLNKREMLDVVDYYHFSDWAIVKKRLNMIREEILSSLEKVESTG
ncbi:MAG: hypothetical protein CVU50_04790 [Candidatus Cloacimonetes bacterium HGW-Cloacimonetes-3]|jgi:hypothetical protein|nr:MAG: hypothetical protein CVU50_04790 [Candidatus Cloacimonetes bacterium HGW-Cloacimonetes-3]